MIEDINKLLEADLEGGEGEFDKANNQLFESLKDTMQEMKEVCEFTINGFIKIAEVITETDEELI